MIQIRRLAPAALSALALAAPLAAAASTPTHLQSKQHPALHRTHGLKPNANATATGKSGAGVYVYPFGSTPIITPRYIYIPGATPDPNAVPTSEDCAVNSNYCTPEQMCEFWGQC